MSKLTKIVLVSASLLLAACIVLVVFVLSLDPNEHKQWIADQFRQQTGWALTLEGEIHYTLYPWLGVSVNKVTIDDTEERTSEPPLFYADHAAFRTRLLPALRGRYEIDTIRLYGARINLRVDREGVGNWRPDPPADGSVTPATGPPAGLPLNDTVIGGVDIKQTAIQWHDARSGRQYRIENLHAGTGQLVYNEPVAFDMDFDLESNSPQLSAHSSMHGQVHYNLEHERFEVPELILRSHLSGPNVPKGREDVALDTALTLNLNTNVLSVETFEFTGADMQLSATAEVRDVQAPNPSLETEVDLKGKSLATLLTIAEMQPLVDQLAGLEDQAFELSATATVAPGHGEFGSKIVVPEFRARLLDATVEGRIEGKDIGSDAPVLQGALSASGANLPTIVQMLGRLQGTESPLATLGRQMDGIPSKSFKIDTEFDADLPNGNLVVPNLRLQLLGSRIEGNLTASALQSDTPQLSGKLQGAGPDLPMLINLTTRMFDTEESALNRYAKQLQAGALEKDFEINVRFDADWQQGNIDLPQLQFNALGLRLNGALTARNMQEDDGSVNGNLRLQGANLPPLLSALDQDEMAQVLRTLKLDIDISGSRTALSVEPLTLELTLQSTDSGKATVNLRADSLIDIDAGAATLERVSLTGPGLDINGRIDLRELKQAPRYNGHITAAPFRPAQLLALFGQSLPEAAAGADVLRTMALETDFIGEQDSVNLSHLVITIDETTLAGTVSVEDFDTPAISFNLSANRLNVDPYLALAGNDSHSATAEQPVVLPLAALRQLDIDGELAVDRVSVSGLQFNDLGTNLHATDGRIALAPISMRLYQGHYDGALHLDAREETAVAEVTGTLAGVAVDPLLTDLLGASFVSGAGNIELSLNARGNTADDLRDTLNGDGRIELEDGVLRGIDISRVLAQTEAMIRARRLLDFERGNATEFESFSATLDVDKGIVRSDDLSLAAADFYITGEGTLVNLKTMQVDYNLKTTVERRTVTTSQGEQYTTGGYTLPIDCTGSIDTPRCAPSVEQVVRAALERTVREKAGSLLRRALGGEEQEDGQQKQADGDKNETAKKSEKDVFNKALESIFREN